MLPFCESGCFVTGTGTYVFLKDKQLFLGLCEKEEKEVKTARGGTNPEKGKIIFCYFLGKKFHNFKCTVPYFSAFFPHCRLGKSPLIPTLFLWWCTNSFFKKVEFCLFPLNLCKIKLFVIVTYHKSTSLSILGRSFCNIQGFEKNKQIFWAKIGGYVHWM